MMALKSLIYRDIRESLQEESLQEVLLFLVRDKSASLRKMLRIRGTHGIWFVSW